MVSTAAEPWSEMWSCLTMGKASFTQLARLVLTLREYVLATSTS